MSEDLYPSTVAVMTITSNDIKEVIETKDDFGHEMRVGVYRVDIWAARPYRAAQMATPVSGKV